MIRAGLITEGEALINTFNPVGETGNDTPRHWLWLELARATYKTGDNERCVKFCLQLRKSLEGVWEDQLDFHVFCLTRMRLCSYVEFLRLEDTIYQDQKYKEAAHMAIEVLLKLQDQTNNNQQGPLTVRSSKKKSKGKKERKTIAEDDQDSFTVNSSNYLDEASRFLKPLTDMFNNDLETFLASFEISKRKRKPLLMLQSVVKMQLIDPSNEKVRESVSFLNDFISSETNLAEPVMKVVRCALESHINS